MEGTSTKPAKEVLLDCLEEAGVSYIFGNPGTTEQGFISSLADRPGLSYMLALQESVVIAMADGYARASGKVAFANLHIAGGLANGLSQLYNAHCGHSHLVVTAGQSDSHLLIHEPQLTADLVAMTRRFTKCAWELRQPTDVPIAVRRAFKVAAQPPSGPVFLSLPIDILDESIVGEPCGGKGSGGYFDTRPDPDGLVAAATVLRNAHKPVILCGDDVGRTGAVKQLVALAEVLGASVYVTNQSEVNFPNDHPQFVRTLNVNSARTKDILADSDAILAIGTPLFWQLLYVGESLLPASVPVIHLDESGWEAGKNQPVEVALTGHLPALCAELREKLEETMSAEDKAAAERRRNEAAKRRESARARLAERIASTTGPAISRLSLMAALRNVASRDTIFVDEAPTSGVALHQVFEFSTPGSLYGARGGALGWGLPGALGVQLAQPERPVIAVVGDGAAMYSIQALWTAAHYRLPVKFIICNNRAYHVLKTNMINYLGEAATKSRFIGMDLVEPTLEFPTVASGFGVPASRIEHPSELEDGLAHALAQPGPYLLDVILSEEA